MTSQHSQTSPNLIIYSSLYCYEIVYVSGSDMLAEVILAAHIAGSDVWPLNTLRLALTLHLAPSTARRLCMSLVLICWQNL
jgi:hypothetical protein